jgi:hypothetical protein
VKSADTKGSFLFISRIGEPSWSLVWLSLVWLSLVWLQLSLLPLSVFLGAHGLVAFLCGHVCGLQLEEIASSAEDRDGTLPASLQKLYAHIGCE